MSLHVDAIWEEGEELAPFLRNAFAGAHGQCSVRQANATDTTPTASAVAPSVPAWSHGPLDQFERPYQGVTAAVFNNGDHQSGIYPQDYAAVNDIGSYASAPVAVPYYHGNYGGITTPMASHAPPLIYYLPAWYDQVPTAMYTQVPTPQYVQDPQIPQSGTVPFLMQTPNHARANPRTSNTLLETAPPSPPKFIIRRENAAIEIKTPPPGYKEPTQAQARKNESHGFSRSRMGTDPTSSQQV